MTVVLVAGLYLTLSAGAVHAQVQVVNTASITPPLSVTNTNPSCASTGGVCTATDTDTVTPSLPSVSKTFAPASIQAGGTSLLTISITNTHALTSATLTALFADVYPAGMVNSSSTALSTCAGVVPSVNAGGSTLTLPLGTVIPSNTACTITTVVTSSLDGSAVNSIPAGSLTTTVGSNPSLATAGLVVTPVVDLAVTKAQTSATVAIGQTNTFTIVMTNAGPSTLTGGSFRDNLPAQFSGITSVSSSVNASASTANFTVGATSVAGSVTIASGGAVTVTVIATAGTAGSYTNTVTVTPPAGTTNTGSTTATVTGTVTTVVNLTVTKAAASSTVAVGQANTFTVVITNAGPSTLTNASFTDNLPARFSNITQMTSQVSGGATTTTLSGVGTTVAAGSITVPSGGAVTVTVVATAGSTGSYTNTVTVTPPAGTTNIGGNTGTVTGTVTTVVNLTVTKARTSSTVSVGQANTFTVVISNAGPSTLTNAPFSDNLPAQFSNITQITSQASGGATTSTFSGVGTTALAGNVAIPTGGVVTVTVVATAGASGSYTNTVTVTPPAGTTNSGNGTGTATGTVTTVVNLTVTKLSATTTLAVGMPNTFTVVISNAGPSTLSNAPFVDNLPPQFSNITQITSQASGGATTGTLTGVGTTVVAGNVTIPSGAGVTVTVVATAGAAGSYTNTVTVSPPAGTTNTGNNTGTATGTVTSMVTLAVTKAAASSTVSVGQSNTFTVVISNSGPSTLTNAPFIDNLPARFSNITQISSQASGGATTSTFSGVGTTVAAGSVNIPSGGAVTVTIIATAASAGSYTNTVTVTPAGGTTNFGNNTGTALGTVTTSVNLAVTKAAATSTVAVGQANTFTVVITNAGPSTLTNAPFVDNLPAQFSNITQITSQASGGATTSTLTGVGTTVVAGNVTVPSGGAVTVTVVASAGTTGSFTNTVTVTLPAGTTNTGNATGTATGTVTTVVNLTVTKAAASSTLSVGQANTFTVVITNAGPSTLTNAPFVDNLPATFSNITQITSQASGGATTSTLTGVGTTVVAGNVTIPTGGVVTITAVATAGTAGNYTNTATVTPPAGTTNTGNGTGTATGTVTTVVNLTVTKAAASSTVAVGQANTFTVVITNAGPSTLTNAPFVDNLPAQFSGITQISSQASGGATTSTFTGVGTTVVAGNVTVPTGGIVTVTVVATAGTAGSYTNTVTVTPPAGTANTGNNTGTATGTVTTVVNLTVTKAAASSTLTVGQANTFTVVVTNAGPSTLTNASFADNLPAQFSNITQITSQASGGATTSTLGGVGTTVASGSFTVPSGGVVTVTVIATAGTSGNYTNTATVTPPAGVTNTGNNTGTVTGSVSASDMAATAVGFPLTAPANTVVSGTFNFVNIHPTGTATTANFSVQLTPNLSAANVTVTSAILGAGTYAPGTGIVTFPSAPGVVNVPPGSTVSAAVSFLQTATSVSGTGTTGATNDTNSANNTATFSVAGTSADISTSFANFPATAPVGSVVNGSVTFTNVNATNTATTAVFSLTLVPGLANVTVTSPVLGAGTYNPATGVVSFTPTNVNVTPSGFVSASISFTQTSTGVQGTGTGGALNDTNAANNTATFSVAATSADISASFANFPATAAVGSVVSGSVTFTNVNASNTATTAVFSLSLTPGLANVTVTSPILGSGSYNPATGIVSFAPGNVNVPPSGVVSASISFTQTSTGVQGTGTGSALNDTNAANNTATFSVTGTAADISTSFANFPATAPVGSVVSGSVTFTNVNATNTATTAVFTLGLVPGLANVTVTSPILGAGTYNPATGVVSFPPSNINVPPSGVVSASISFTQTSTGVQGTATGSALNDTNATNNTATFSVTGTAADISTSFANFPPTAPVGSVVSGSVTFTNVNATNTATTAVFSLTLTPGLANVTVTSPILGAGTYNPATGVVIFPPSNINVPPSGVVSASISFTQTSTGVQGTGTGSALNDTNPANNTGTFSVTGTAADISTSFANFPPSAPVGSVVAGSVTFTNLNATNTATTAAFTLSLVPGLANVTVTSPILGAGTYNPATGIVSFPPSNINVPPSGVVSASISFTQTSTGVQGTGTGSALNDTNAANNTSTFSVTGTAADISTSFANFPPTAPVGSVVSGSVTFTNVNASNTATTAVFSLTLVPGLTGVTVTSPILGAGTYNAVTGVVSFPPSNINVPPGGVVSASISFTQTSTGVQGTGTGNALNDTNPANNTGTFSVTGTSADMRATLDGFPASAPVSSIVNGTANFTNITAAPAGTATTAVFSITLSPGLNGVTVTSAILGAGVYNAGTGVVTFPGAPAVVNVPPLGVVSASIGYVQTSTSVLLTATTGALNDTIASNNTATLTITGTAADMSATLAGFPVTAPVNTVVSGTASFVNLNASNIATTAVFSITLSPGLTNVTVTSAQLGAGTYNAGTGAVTFPTPSLNVAPSGTVTAAVSFTQPNSPVQVTGATGAVNDTNAANNTATLTVGGSAADMSATLASFPTNAPVNTLVAGTSVFVNTSASNTATTAVFSITLTPGLANVTVTSAQLGAGTYNAGTGVVTFATPSLNVAPLGTVSASINYLQPNSAVQVRAATGAVNDVNPANNTATLTVTGSAADMSASFAGFPPSAPVATAVTGTANFVNITANPAGTATTAVFTITLSPNLAAVTVTSAVLGAGVYNAGSGVVTFPAAPAVVNVAPLGTVSASISFTQTSTNVSLTATTGAINDTNPANNTATLLIAGIPVADLGITKAASSAVGTVGQTISYVITFGNAGPSPAANMVLTDVLPTGVTLVSAQASVGVLATSTASVTLTMAVVPVGTTGVVTVTASIGAGAAGSIVNVANITSLTLDPTTANNSATATVGKTDSTDLRVALTVPANATPGSTVTAVIVVTNAGPSPAVNVTGTLTLSAGTSTTATTVLSVFSVPSLPANSSTTTIVSYSVPPAQTAPMSWTATVATTVVETNYGNNTATAVTSVAVVTNASLSGRVWYDINRNRVFDNAPSDTPLPGFRVELLQGTTIVGTATTGDDGRYTITGQVPGTGYSVRFRDPLGNVIYGTPFNQATVTQNNNPSTGTNSSTAAVSPNQQVVVQGSIDNITLYVGDNVQEQNLPLDPSGVVYDSIARTPIAGATVKLVGPAGFNPAVHLLSGTDTQVTPVFGLYQFLFIGVNDPDPAKRPPTGVYTLQVTAPAGYAPPVAVQGGVAAPQGTFNVPAGVSNIQAQATPPAAGVNGVGPTGGPGTQYYFNFQFNFPGSGEVFNNHIPLDPLASGAILVNKVGNKTVAEVGDSVQYTVRMRNTTGAPIGGITLEDLLPAGFRYILETTRLNGATVTNPLGGVGRALTFNIGTIPANAVYELTYFVRLGVGSQQGDGTNRATAVFPGAGGSPVRSNTALFKVNVQGGVFSNDGCIVGKVYVDCDGNFVQNNEGGSREVGIPGVRLVMLDGTWIVTDNEGKYSMCGVKAQTQVVKVDRTTLPKGARLVPSSNRNAGVAGSLFVDMRGGEMHRADFIEGSCSPEVMDDIKARRAQGGVSLPETEKDSRALLPELRPALAMPAAAGGVR